MGREVSLYNPNKIKLFPRNAITGKRLFIEHTKIPMFPDERPVQNKACKVLLQPSLSVEFCIENRVFFWKRLFC